MKINFPVISLQAHSLEQFEDTQIEFDPKPFPNRANSNNIHIQVSWWWQQ